MSPLQDILVATDFSPCAQAALDLAVDIALGKQSRILLLHAYELPTTAGEESPLAVDSFAIERIERGIDELLGAERARVAQAGLDLRVERAFGHPPEIILRYARTMHAGLIVMGTHGRRGLERLFLGSVADRVLRAAPCPVLVVREPAAGVSDARSGGVRGQP